MAIIVQPYPGDIRKAPIIPYHELLPHVDVIVTNGGNGGTQFALAYGIPLVAADSSEGKNEVCARIAWTGAGINLHTEKPTPLLIREAVKKVMADPRYKQRAKTIQADYARHDTPGEAVELLKKLAITQKSILRQTSKMGSRNIAARVDYRTLDDPY